VAGSDAAAGTQAAPMQHVAAAVARARGLPQPAAVVLRAGVHRLTETLALGAADNGLTIAAFDGEAPVVTGALPLPPLTSWQPYNVTNSTPPHWGPVLPDHNAVSGECPSGSVPDKGVMKDWQTCQASCQGNTSCTAWTFHTVNCTGCTGWINHCCWRTDGEFPAIPQLGVYSQQLTGGAAKNVWVAALPALPAGAPPTMTALRINGHRATLARFPNANPETDIVPKGYIGAAKSWLPPAPGPVAWRASESNRVAVFGLQGDPDFRQADIHLV
jgi:hypothetical protein